MSDKVIVFCDCGVEFSIPKGHTLHKEKKCIDCFSKGLTELEKWAEVHENVVVIEEFLNHICNNGYGIHQFYVRDGESDWDKSLPQILQPVAQNERRKLLEQFFDIDAEKLERERRELLSVVKVENK